MQITSGSAAWRIYLSLPGIRRERIDGLDRQIRFRRVSGTKRHGVPVVLVLGASRYSQQRKNRTKRFIFY